MSKRKTILFALKKSIPVMFGYIFLGTAFGIMLYDIGYNWLWAVFMSVIVYSGAGQFLLVSLLASNAGLPTVLAMSFFINSRHMFYGISFIEKFKTGGIRYPYLIFSLTDETYSINLTFDKTEDEINEVQARFYLGLFDQLYWIIGSAIGSLIGQALTIDFTGIDFSMTALFVVIFIELMTKQKGKGKLVGFVGIFCAIICLIIFGTDKFILPTMLLLVALLSGARPYFDSKKEVM